MGFRACQCLHDAHCGLVSHTRNKPSQKQSPVPRVCATIGLDRRPHGKSPARPPLAAGDPWSSARLEGWEKDGRVFRQPSQCGCFSALWTTCDQKGNPRRPISPHHRHVVRLVSTHDTPGCTACSSSISRLWQKWNVPLRFGSLHHPFSTLALCPCPPQASNDPVKLNRFDGSLGTSSTTVIPRLEKKQTLVGSRPRRSCWGRWDRAVHSPNSAVRRIITTGAHQMARPSLPCACKPREIVLLGAFASHHQLILACLAPDLK